MDDEAAFLAALSANPADDVCRLVFADWLEDREQFDKATYLRLACRAVEAIGTPEEAGVTDQILAASEPLPWGWRNAAAGRFGLMLVDYPHGQKIRIIKALRELFGWGLAEAKAQSESLPNQLYSLATYEDVVCACSPFGNLETVDLQILADDRRVTQRPRPPYLTDQPYDLYITFQMPYAPNDDTPVAASESTEAEVGQFIAYHSASPSSGPVRFEGGEVHTILRKDLPLTTVTKLLPEIQAEGQRIAQQHDIYFYAYSYPAAKRSKDP